MGQGRDVPVGRRRWLLLQPYQSQMLWSEQKETGHQHAGAEVRLVVPVTFGLRGGGKGKKSKQDSAGQSQAPPYLLPSCFRPHLPGAAPAL